MELEVAEPIAAETPEITSVDSASSTETDYSTLSDDDILNAGDEDAAAGEAPAEDTEIAQVPVEAKPVDEEAQKAAEAAKAAEMPVTAQIEPAELKALFKQYPKMRDTWYQEKAYREVFPTVAEARAVKELFPNADVARSAADMQATLLRINDTYLTKPGEFATRLAQTNPGAFTKLMENSRETLYQVDPQAYRSTFAEPAVQDFVLNMKDIGARAGDEELNAALDILEDRLGWKAGAAGAKPAGPVDPRIAELERLKADTEKFVSAGVQAFSDSVDKAYWTGLHQTVTAAIGKPAAMSDKAVEMVTREVMQEVSNAMKARRDLPGVYQARKRAGDMSPQHQKAASDFLLQYARQFVPQAVKARLNEWTQNILANNRAEVAKKTGAPQRKDVGSGSGSGRASGRVHGVDYRKMSDDDILNS